MEDANGMLEVNVEYDPKVAAMIVALKKEIADKDKKIEEFTAFLKYYQLTSNVSFIRM
jgi:hypothetical protein